MIFLKTAFLKSALIIPEVIFMFLSPAYSQQERPIPPKPDSDSFSIEFNGDYLKGFCLVLDFRSADEKAADLKRKSTAGDVIIFTSGHAQRPGDGYPLTSKLASWSKSGIVIIPVCDTPFGLKKEWRGDRGKDALLMEIARYKLLQMGLSVKNYKPVTDMPVKINGSIMERTSDPDSVQAGIAMIGWSHGALLARRLAHAYPGSVNSLVQMAPAGFADWGGSYCSGPACITSGFMAEGACVGLGIFRGEWSHISDISCGITQGLAGDTGRSCSSCISGNFSFLKLFRGYKDTIDCTLYADDSILPLPEIKNVAVIFATDDTLFEYDDHAGIKDPGDVTPEETELFFEKFYPSSVKSGANVKLAVLPGNHLGPLVYSGKYAESALLLISERRGFLP